MKKCIPLIAFIAAPYLFFLLIILLPSLPIFYYCNGYQIIFISFLIIRYFITRCNPENVKTGSTV